MIKWYTILVECSHVLLPMHRGKGTHVHALLHPVWQKTLFAHRYPPVLTCWPWCYSVQLCHGMNSVTPGSLSSLPSPPTRLPLTTDISFISLCLSAILLFAPHSLSLCSKFLLLSLLQGHYVLFLTLCHLHSHFSSYSHLFVSLSLSLSFHSFHPFHSFHRPTLADLGGKQAMTVVLAVDREVTFAQPRWDLTATSEPQKQREEDGGVVTAK